MNKKKTGIIAVMLFAIIGMGTYLVADAISSVGLIQTGDYFENKNHITVPNPTDNMSLQDVELEDIYSIKVADLYNIDSAIYSAGNIEFVYNLDDNNNFVDGYITKSSDATANYDSGDDECSNLAYPDYCLTEDEYNNLTSDIPEIEELDSPEEYDNMSTDEQKAYDQKNAEIDAMYEEALSGYDIEEANEQSVFTDDDVIVDYYDNEDAFNNAISNEFGQEMTYQDLQDYIQ